MKQLEADIKNKIYKNIYVLYGPQSYNRKRYEKALVSLFVAKGDTMNLTYYYGKKIDIKEIIDLAQTMPFMAEKRVIVLENTELFSHSCEELADYIPNIYETTCLIFSEDKIDLRLRQTKAAKSKGTVAEFADLSDADLRDFILKRLSREHRQITANALEMFMQRCGDDLWQVSGELEKIISYTFKKDGIRPEDVEAVMPPLPEDRIFAMIDAILDHDTKKAVSLYADLLTLRNEPISILSLIREQMRLILHAMQMNEEHVSPKDMAQTLGMREMRVKMALPAARKSSKIDIRHRIEMCADTDERIKSGLLDPRVGVEMLIVELCIGGS